MASAAFKSTSRRGNDNCSSSSKRRIQRSLSVSAVPRIYNNNSADTIIETDFLNKRDNPLFWTTNSSSPPLDDDDEETPQPKHSNSNGVEQKRGRSVSRNGPEFRDNKKKTLARSLSRPHFSSSQSEVEPEFGSSTNYRRINYFKSALGNVKRPNSVRSGTTETEVELEPVKPSNYRNSRKLSTASGGSQKPNSVRNLVGTLARTRSLQSVSNHHSIIEASDDSTTSLKIPNWEDEISTSSLSEAEEKKAVCEEMKSFQANRVGDVTSSNGIYETVQSEVRRAISDIQNDLESAIRRKSSFGVATTDLTSIPLDLVKPVAVELVLDVRREYGTKLEESQERARQLRSDLAEEEHRVQELSRILKETLPDPKTSAVQRSHPARRTSSERKRMSKRLTEEAMSYFDECVSISTFDSSDFSAAEDQPSSSFGATTPVNLFASLPQASPYITENNGLINCQDHKKDVSDHRQLMHCHEDSGLTVGSSSCDPAIDKRDTSLNYGRKSQFSFAREASPTTGLQQEFRSYIKKFEKGVDTDNISPEITKYSSFNMEDYDLRDRTENLLFDRVSFKNSIESGGFHLCAGGLAMSFSTFPSVI